MKWFLFVFWRGGWVRGGDSLSTADSSLDLPDSSQARPIAAQSDLALKFSTGGYDFTGSPWSGSQFQSTFGSSASGPNSMYIAFALEAIPVPEPSTWAMGFACLVAAAGGRRRAARRTRWVERQPRVRRYGVR